LLGAILTHFNGTCRVQPNANASCHANYVINTALADGDELQFLSAQGHKLREVPPYADVRAVEVELSAARLPERQRLLARSTLPQLPAPRLVAPPAAPAGGNPGDISSGQQDRARGSASAGTKLDTWLLPELWLPPRDAARAGDAGSAAAEAPAVAGALGSAHWLAGAVRRQRPAAVLCLPAA